MRFLKVDQDGKVVVTKDLNKAPGPYAILSHTWSIDGEEIYFDDLRNDLRQEKPSFGKLWFCINQARRDSLEYVELSKAIISMFRWYQNSTKCYVYLSDVSVNSEEAATEASRTWETEFKNSRWFRRGWTLQELLAPPVVEFFSAEGQILGSKRTLEGLIHQATRIPVGALRGVSLSSFPVTERFSWTEGRETTEPEDKAYCLLGIFNVFLPLIYGEGENAFKRLKDAVQNPIDSSESAIVHAYHRGRLRFERLSVQCSPVGNRWSNICIVDHKRTYPLVLTHNEDGASLLKCTYMEVNHIAKAAPNVSSFEWLESLAKSFEKNLDPASHWTLVWGGAGGLHQTGGKEPTHDFLRERMWSNLCHHIIWLPLRRTELTHFEVSRMNLLIRLYHEGFNGNNWGPFDHALENSDGLEAIISVSWGLEQLNMFKIGPASQMYHKWFNGTEWNPSHQEWEDLGGRFNSPPTAASWGPNRIDVFGLGTDNQTYHKYWDGSAWRPSIQEWEGLGGTFNSPVSVISWGPNRLDIFGLGTDDKMYHKWWSGSAWFPSHTGWECLGGQFSGSPALASWGSNRLNVFALGTDDMIYHKAWDGMYWNPPEHTWQKLEDVIKSRT